MTRRRCSRAPPPQIKGVGFTGVSEIQLDGAVKGAPPITQIGPQGCPVIPSSSGGLGALLNSAPELIDRIQRLTERLTELLSDKNQNSISDILENVEKTTDVLAERAPDLADAIGDARIAARNAGIAAQRVGVLADSTNRLVNEQGKPAAEDLRKAIAVGRSRPTDNLDAMIADARPGVQNFTKSTLARSQPPGPRPARAVRIAAGRSPSGSSRRASAARSGPRSCPTTSRGRR